MRLSRCFMGTVLIGFAAIITMTANAQTLATGDTRTVIEPTFPAVCSTVYSQMAIVNGGPASETAFDTTRIQSALTTCPSGKAVELAASGGNYAFLIAPINIPNGVGLIVDGGVTVFASRNPADYQITSGETCGSYGANGSGCNNLIKLNSNGTSSGIGIYGYGVIDGRGGSTMLKNGVDSGISWWTNSDQANTAGSSQDNPIIMKSSHANNFVLYKITLRNSPMFHVGWGGTGFTAWGVKISAPFTAHNTDGIDPTGSNITVTNASISDGDDNIAVGASSASSNVTISNVTTYSGHGVSVGSYTSSGLTNMLVTNVNMAGTAADGNATGLRLKSAADRGGLLNTITYQNICIRDIRYPLQLNPFYNTNTGTLLPQFQNIVYQNVHVLTPTGTQYPYQVQLQGYDANHVSTVTMNNVVFDQLLAANVKPAPEYTTIALAGNVYPAFLQTLTGTGVSYTGTATSTATGGASACTNPFPYIVGELYLSTASATNLQNASIAPTDSVTLDAMVEPAMSQTTFNGTVGNWTGTAAPTQSVSFYEGSTLVGTAALGANGTLAPLTLTNVTTGTHTYTAQYPGDAKYSALTFGSVTVTVAAATVATTTTLTAPATSTYGSNVTLSVTVTGAGGTPTGSVAFYDGTTSLGSTAMVSGAASLIVSLTGGTHSLTAVYSGDATFVKSTSTASTLTVTSAGSTTTVTANPTTVSVNGTTALTVTVTGVTGAPLPTGTVNFADGSTSLGSATLNSATGAATFTATMPTGGARTVTASYMGDGNYAASSGATAVQVTVATTTTLTAPATAIYGASFTLSATVSATGSVPTGSLSFYDGTTLLGTAQTLVNGTASLSGVTLLGGAHNLTAVYAGTATYVTSTSSISVVTVSTASTTTLLAITPTTLIVNGSATFTTTITSTVSPSTPPTGTVTFTDGSTSLGVASVASSTGTATITVPLTTLGSNAIKTCYSGDTNYAASCVTVNVTVNAIATTTTLSLSSLTVYPGGVVALTATMTPAVATQTVTFLNGTATLGTAQTNASGVATFAVTAGAMNTIYTLSANVMAAGNYGASSSAVQALTVVAPITMSALPNPISIAPGSSGTVNLTLTPAGGFTGAVTLTCTPAASYVTCTTPSSSVSVIGLAPGTTSETINVAATTSMLTNGTHGDTLLALLAPFGLLGLVLGTRKRLQQVMWMLLLAMGILVGITGCGAGSSASSSTGGTAPSGSQTVTLVATAAGISQTTTITVNIR